MFAKLITDAIPSGKPPPASCWNGETPKGDCVYDGFFPQGNCIHGRA